MYLLLEISGELNRLKVSIIHKPYALKMITGSSSIIMAIKSKYYTLQMDIFRLKQQIKQTGQNVIKCNE